MIEAWAKTEALSSKILESSGVYVRLANGGYKVVGLRWRPLCPASPLGGLSSYP